MTIFLESPMPVLFLGVVAIAALAIAFFNTGRGIFLAALGGVIVVAMLGLTLEYFVITDREEVEIALYGLADAIEANDKPTTMSYLAPSAVKTRDRAEEAFSRVAVEKLGISGLKVTVNNLTSPPSASAQFNGFIQIRDRSGQLPGNIPCYGNFTLDFRREKGRWLVAGHSEKWENFAGTPH